MGLITRRLNGSSADPQQLATNEAAAISRLPGGAPLRLHVVGDCRDNGSARIVSKAAELFSSQNRQPVWTYTHAWRDVDRSSWGGVSVLASCESTQQAHQAIQRGYAASIVVSSYPKGGKAWSQDGLKIVPCPYESSKKTCTECRLCWQDKKLRDLNVVVAFKVHGTGQRKLRENVLNVIS